MALTIKDIATHLGVSHMTVSSALSGRGRVAAGTRDRVLQAARELGYRPNASARSMRAGRFGNIGLLLSDAVKRSYLPHQLLRGIQIELERHDIQLTVGRLPDDMLVRDGYVPALLRHWSADGMLINYQEGIPGRMIELIEGESSMPAVWINSKQHGSCVYLDDYQCGRLAAETLLRAGHTRIGYADYSHGLADWQQAHYSHRDRFAGVVDVLRDAGLVPVDLRGPRTLEGNERQPFSRTWIQRTERPTAIVCYSASTAIPIVVAAWQVGLQIPQDLSVVCIDENPSATLGFKFDTVVTPLEEIGQQAVRAVVGRIEGKSLEVTNAVPGVYEPGESVAAPRIPSGAAE